MVELSHAISISREITETYCSIERKLNRVSEIIENNGNGNGNHHKQEVEITNIDDVSIPVKEDDRNGKH